MIWGIVREIGIGAMMRDEECSGNGKMERLYLFNVHARTTSKESLGCIAKWVKG